MCSKFVSMALLMPFSLSEAWQWPLFFSFYPELNLNLNTSPNINLKSQEPENCAQLQIKIIKLRPAELVVYAGCKVIGVS
jgi:hypothetical protein